MVFLTLNTARIRKVLVRAACLPGLSFFSSHFSCALIFLYLSWCCAHTEAAVLTLAVSSYALLVAPVHGISDAAANGFSRMHAGHLPELFSRFRKNLIAVRLTSSAMVFTLFSVVRLAGIYEGPCNFIVL